MRLVVLWNVDFDPCHSREKLADWVPMSTFEKRDAAFTRVESFSIGEFNSVGGYFGYTACFLLGGGRLPSFGGLFS